MAFAQNADPARADEVEELRQMVRELSARVAALEEQARHQLPQTANASAKVEAASAIPATTPASAAAPSSPAPSVADSSVISSSAAAEGAVTSAPRSASTTAQSTSFPGVLPGGATLNFLFDGYYGYDFNHPLGRVQYLRAYDVLSNAFSINQTGIVLALDPNVDEGRRYGVRLDLQFGQATDTLQGNPATSPGRRSIGISSRRMAPMCFRWAKG
ncbi:outer membrane beta-barrel protein [Edaphobacter aggregans]|uniref:outer membrane beta-barrel protein n=1 Tax=Edaphobacter aggregans TaxID=570835 RepID=UPI000557B3F3|nr:outer membrane beta-barrel protein [Edaphobacter aggregans]